MNYSRWKLILFWKNNLHFLPFPGVQGGLWHTAIAAGGLGATEGPRSQRVLDALRCILSLIWDPFFGGHGHLAGAQLYFFMESELNYFFHWLSGLNHFFRRISGQDYFFQFYTRPPPPPGYVMVNALLMAIVQFVTTLQYIELLSVHCSWPTSTFCKLFDWIKVFNYNYQIVYNISIGRSILCFVTLRDSVLYTSVVDFLFWFIAAHDYKQEWRHTNGAPSTN